MLTKMTDTDWITVLRVFEAVRSRRGDKGRDERKFLSALHYFAVHNITWRTLPAEFGKWNSVLQGPRPYRANSRQTQTIQAHRIALREDSAELWFVRRTGMCIHLDQIRPHGLANIAATLGSLVQSLLAT
jgi:transposase